MGTLNLYIVGGQKFGPETQTFDWFLKRGAVQCSRALNLGSVLTPGAQCYNQAESQAIRRCRSWKIGRCAETHVFGIRRPGNGVETMRFDLQVSLGTGSGCPIEAEQREEGGKGVRMAYPAVCRVS